MIAAILTKSPSSYAVRQLTEVGQLRGHEMVVVDYRQYFGNSEKDHDEFPSIVDLCAGYITFFAWLDPDDLSLGLAVMRECETSGADSPNSSEAITRVCDRLWLAQTLTKAGIPMPHTVISHSIDDTAALLDSVGEGPWVMKLLTGTHSFEQIIVAETRKAALLALAHLSKLDRDFFLQRYIAEANNADLRVLVVGGRVIAAVSRQLKGGAVLPEWSTSVVPSELDVQERTLAASATSVLELDIADVTLLRSKQGPLVLDVSPFPPLQWWDQHALESVAHRIFDLIESPWRPLNTANGRN